MSTPTVDRILVAPKARVDRSVNLHCSRGLGGPESYRYRVKKVANPPERESSKYGRPTSLTV